MRWPRSVLAAAVVVLSSHLLLAADFFDVFSFKTGHKGTVSLATLSNYEMNQGAKEALASGVRCSITNLGRLDGFLKQADVTIPIPDRLRRVEKNLRTQKQEALVEEFVLHLNRSAERAMTQAAPLVEDAAQSVTINDAQDLLTASPTGLTDFFRKSSRAQLENNILPLVQKASDETGLTATYAKLMKNADLSGSWFNLGRRQLDLNEYLTGKALDALFKRLGEEEKRIRENPAESPSELVKKVFSAL